MGVRVLVVVTLAACSFRAANEQQPGGDARGSRDGHAAGGSDGSDGGGGGGSDGGGAGGSDGGGGSDASGPLACDLTNLTCASGNVQLITCNSACWASCQLGVPIRQTDAAAACVAWQGELAPLREVADQDCVANAIFHQQSSWTGFEQAAGQADPAAGWSWDADNQPPAFVNWDNGQPNDGDGTEDGTEQCAYMTTSGGWQDAPCDATFVFRFSCRRAE